MGEAKVDFSIVTAIEIERRAVCKAFQLTDNDRVFKESRVYWRKSLELKNGEYYNIVVAQSPDMANVDAALLASDIMHHWHPGAILLVGIAAGVDPEKQSLGDIIIGRDIYYYERGKVTPDGKQPEPIMYRADATLLNHVQALPDWLPSGSVVRPDGTQMNPRVHVGVIASGEKVIADKAVHEDIAAGHGKIAAIEMEGYGFSAGAWQSFEPVRHLVIKAICDFADVHKGDEWHSYAANVAAEFTRHLLFDQPLAPCNPPHPPPPVQLDEVQNRYRLIINALRTGNLVPFLGPGIASRFHIELAHKLVEFAQRKLPSIDGENQSPNEKLIQTLVGIPCAVCPYWPEERPLECPMLKEMDRSHDEDDCTLVLEQQLAVSKINLRYVCQYFILQDGLEAFYDDLYEIVEGLEESHKPFAFHQFLSKLPHIMLAHNVPRSNPGLPFQLIVTTNFDDLLEQAFEDANQPYDVVFYIADGSEKGSFKHKPYGKEAEIIGIDDSKHLPLPEYCEHPRPIILKLFGTWEEAWQDYFVGTEQQVGYLVSTLERKLPTALLKILRRSKILFMGFSPSDPDLQYLMNSIWEGNRVNKKSCLLHRAKLGSLEQELWNDRNVTLLDLPATVEDFVTQLEKAIEVSLSSHA
jgi:nucleoside phosphorylase